MSDKAQSQGTVPPVVKRLWHPTALHVTHLEASTSPP